MTPVNSLGSMNYGTFATSAAKAMVIRTSSARLRFLRTREVADDGHLVAVRGDCKAGRSECAVQDDRSMWRTSHPRVERCARSSKGSSTPVDDLARVAGPCVARIG